MIKIVSGVKTGFVVLLNIIAIVLSFVSFIIPVYRYEWTKDPNLSKIVNSEAVLAVLTLSVLSLIVASIAFVLKKKSRIAPYIFLALIISIVYKLINVIPLYQG